MDALNIFFADADVRKDPNSTIEMLSRMLDNTIKQVTLREATRPVHWNVQLDNTASENKNTLVMTFFAWVVAKKKMRATTWSGMQSGHSHIDQDQRFSVARAVFSKQEKLEDPPQFMACLEQGFPPARGRALKVDRLEAAHNWASFFAPLDLKFHGHTTPHSMGAIHSFTFVRWADLQFSGFSSEEVDTDGFPNHTLQDGDVIMLTKQYMSSKALSQGPLLVLPHYLLGELDESRLSCGPAAHVLPRNPVSSNLLDKFAATAVQVSKEPWAMEKAAKYLKEWTEASRSNCDYRSRLWPIEFLLSLEPLEEQDKVAEPVQWKDFAPMEAHKVRVSHRGPKPGATSMPGQRVGTAGAKATAIKGGNARAKTPAARPTAFGATSPAVSKAAAKRNSNATQTAAAKRQRHSQVAVPMAHASHDSPPAIAKPKSTKSRWFLPDLPRGVTFGCSKCAKKAKGCAACRARAGWALSEDRSQWVRLASE